MPNLPKKHIGLKSFKTALSQNDQKRETSEVTWKEIQYIKGNGNGNGR